MVVNSTTDIVNALVAKGVLTEEEGALLNKGRTDEAAGQAKALKKASKLSVSDAIDNATLYGDMRVRYENRRGDINSTNANASIDASNLGDLTRERGRYKATLGVTTKAGDFYTDLAISTGSKGRSDNETFAGTKAPADFAPKKTAYINRAMIGWKATDWLTLEAGRMKNPLYTTQMVWDADLPLEGLVEKFTYKIGDVNLFANLGQVAYESDSLADTDASALVTSTNGLLFEQLGAQFPIVQDKSSAKAAVTFYTYTHNDVPQGASAGTGSRGAFKPGIGQAALVNSAGVNNLSVIEVPAEINFMATNNIGIRAYGDYAINTDADARATAAGTTYSPYKGSNDDTAWLVGFVVGSAKDLKTFESNKMAKGDWSMRLWYQEVGVWSLDQNLVDSDFFDSRVNTKGTVFKAQYNIQDNVYANFAYGHASRLNKDLGVGSTAGYDIPTNWNSFDLIQLDLTYKF